MDILKALKANDWGAGALIQNPAEESVKSGNNNLPDGNVMETWSGLVDQSWTDYNGHMTEFRYLEVFSMATDRLLVWIGGGPAYVETGASWYTIETHIKHLDEVAAGKPMRVETQLVQHDDKRVHLFHHLYGVEKGNLLATGEHMLMHVDMAAGRSSVMPDAMKSVLDVIAERQADMPKPDAAGAAIGIRQKVNYNLRVIIGELIMHFRLTEEQEMIVDTVRSFVENEIYPLENEIERLGEVPKEIADEIKSKVLAMGFYAPNFPEDVGGGGLNHLEFALLERELGRGSMALTHFWGRPQNILMACEGEQREKYLLPAIRGERMDALAMTEPDAGSDVRGMKTTARRDGDDWIFERHQTFYFWRGPC